MVDIERSARGRSARARGNQTERDWSAFLRREGWPDAERAVRTGFRTSERAVADPGDVRGCPGLIWSLKYLSADFTAHVARSLLDEAQAMRHESGDPAIAVLVERRKGRLAPAWWCWLTLDDLAALAMGPFAEPGAALGATMAMPVRMTAADLIDLLHANGYGLSSADQGERAG